MININFGNVLKHIGSFITKNWQTLALITLIVFFFLSRNDYGALKRSMEVMTTSYQEQIQAMERLHKKELRLREESITRYEQELADLNQKYAESLKSLQEAKEEDINKFERDFNEQPEQLASEIAEQFGFTYVE